MGQRVLNGERAPIHEVRIRSKSDEYITVEFTTTPLMQNGSIVGFLGVGRDVTERKKLEVQLQRARKMEAIGTISGAVAHDLNNILSGLVTYPDLLLMEIPEGSPLRKPILTIQKSGEKVTAIVQDLLTLARRGVVTAEVVNFNDQSLVPIEDYMGKGESILVVDDVEEQREVASRVLKKLGYSVTSVSSGEEAVDYLKSNSADLLVLDMIMDPGIDGLETYKRILEFHPRQKALIVSGFSETERVKEAQILGAGAYLKKPFLLEKIGLAVRDELDK